MSELSIKDKKRLDCFFPKINGMYRTICLYNGYLFPKCPNNENGLCMTNYLTYPYSLIHRFDGKNNIKCLCG